jgi:hypothetical protein
MPCGKENAEAKAKEIERRERAAERKKSPDARPGLRHNHIGEVSMKETAWTDLNLSLSKAVARSAEPPVELMTATRVPTLPNN